jgi:(4S)-4-hydroxy-5-phosphonooxypentane-2,3-dione isomerase
MSFVLAVTWVAKPGEEAAVERILRTMTPLARAERGCLQYVAHRSPDDPRRFFLYEVFEDEAAFTQHAESRHFKRYVLGEALPRLQSRERTFFESLE